MKGEATSVSDDEGKRDSEKESDVADGIRNTNRVRKRQSEIGMRKGKREEKS